MNILVTDVTNKEHEAFFRAELSSIGEVTITELSLAEYIQTRTDDIEIVSCFVTSSVGKAQIDLLPNLKYITTRSTGFDHIDCTYAAEKDVVVSNVPFYGSRTVAEHTFSLLLAVTRRLVQSADRVRSGDFTYQGLEGIDLFRKTIGLVGGGHIGMCAAQIARGFGMDVLVYDVAAKKELAEEHQFSYVTLEQLFEKSDIVSLHVPLLPSTKHIIDDEAIAQMKNGVIIVNTARGGLIDTQALLHGLQSGKVGGAGLDVLEGEEFLKRKDELVDIKMNANDSADVLGDLLLIGMENVVVTPHNAFNTQEAHFRNAQTTVENILKFVEGGTQYVVNNR